MRVARRVFCCSLRMVVVYIISQFAECGIKLKTVYAARCIYGMFTYGIKDGGGIPYHAKIRPAV